MRWNGFLLTSLLVAISLSGCLGSDDGDDTDDLQALECPDVHVHDHDDHGDADDGAAGDDDDALDDLNATLGALRARQVENGTAGNETDASDASEASESALADPCAPEVPATPNVPPVAGLSMVADDGTVQNGSSFILVGQNVTFSAAGSQDDDGIRLAALTVTDSNSTRTVQLFDEATGAFSDAELAFEHEGPVNVTLRVLDDDGDTDILDTMLYVNRVQSLTISIDAPMPSGHSTEDCTYPTEDTNIIWQRSMYNAKFVVNKGAQWLEVTMTGGSGEFTLCDPSDVPLTDPSTDTASTERGAGMPANPQYGVFGMAKSGVDDLTFDVMVHYEP